MVDQHNEHDFDGIEEHDNPLPGWWLGIFWVTIIYGIIYVLYFHVISPESLPRAKWEADVKKAEAARAALMAAPAGDAATAGMTEEERMWAEYKAGGWEATAKAQYDLYCVPCHLTDGGGSIGPNFTDDYYIHGGKLTDIKRTIVDGVPEKGMVSWKPVLKPKEIDEISYYIRSLRGNTPAVAKEPQGQLVDEAGNFIEEEAPATEE